MKLKYKIVYSIIFSSVCCFIIGASASLLLIKHFQSIKQQEVTINKISLLLLDNTKPYTYINNILANQQLIVNSKQSTTFYLKEIPINLDDKITDKNNINIELTCYFSDIKFNAIKLKVKIISNDWKCYQSSMIISDLNIYISNIYNNKIDIWAFCKISN